MEHTGTEDIQSPKAVKRHNKKLAKTAKQHRRNPKPIQARGANQKRYIKSLHQNDLTLATGPAGVGKTYVSARVFGTMLSEGSIGKIYIARPNVAKSKHRMGFLPGSAEEKTAPWVVPVMEGLQDSMAPSDFTRFMREEIIEIVPYEFMQGRTFSNAAFLVDEGENLDLDDLYITLTRQGENLRTAISGDVKQARINNSGLQTVINMANSFNMVGVGIVEFGSDDVVRSVQARQWVKAFDTLPMEQVEENKGTFTYVPEFLRQ